MHEYNVDPLYLLGTVALPKLLVSEDKGYFAQRFVAVLKDDNRKIACVSGDDEESHIWIMFIRRDVEESIWKHVWSRKNMKEIRSVHSIKDE